MRKPTHKAKLSGDHYGYKKGSLVKCYPADNLPYQGAMWIQNARVQHDYPVGLLLRIDNDYEAIKPL